MWLNMIWFSIKPFLTKLSDLKRTFRESRNTPVSATGKMFGAALV